MEFSFSGTDEEGNNNLSFSLSLIMYLHVPIRSFIEVCFRYSEIQEKGGSIILKNCTGVAIGENYTCMISPSQSTQELEKSKGKNDSL